jgi:GNAT superfamily N-acetyltransferase
MVISMEIRSARKEDCESCMKLLKQLWSPEYELESHVSRELPPDKFDRIYNCILDNPNCEVIVAEKDGELVAMMDMDFRESFFHGGLTMQIEDLIVDGRFRRQGIGQRMVGLAEELARRRGCAAIELSSDLYREETHKFWQAMGYEIEAYQLRKALESAIATQP